MDQILTDLFPFIFYRGFNRNRGNTAQGPLNLKDRRRLFCFYDLVAATNISLLTYVFDAHRRSCAMFSAKVKTKGNFTTVHRTLDSFRKFVLRLPVGSNINDARFSADLSREMKKFARLLVCIHLRFPGVLLSDIITYQSFTPWDNFSVLLLYL